jgi:hypothetical protein
VGEKVQELTAVSGVWFERRTEPARRGPEAAAAFRRSECKKATGVWPGSFYV